MAATYPASIRAFTTKVNIVDIIDETDANYLQEEVVAIESILGVTPSLSTTPSASGTFNATSTTFATVSARLANIETGIVADTHTQYVKRDTLTTKGDLYVATAASTIARIGVGTDGQVLTAASGQASGLSWATPVSSYVSQTNGAVTTASTSSAVVRNIHVSTSNPSGGIDGDVWLKYA
jgi:hypothetical protein